MNVFQSALAASLALSISSAVSATELEVTHWWTSGGEAEAVAELAKAFDATGNKWVDGAIAGSGGAAIPIMISRITGGDPMGATQFNHGRQAEELVEAGFMRDLTALADKEGWKDSVYPPSLLESCTLDGKIYCVPMNIHSWQWLWLSTQAFEDAGVDVPTNWDEFVAAAPALEKADIVPLAMGQQSWQTASAFNVLMATVAEPEVYNQVFDEKDADVAAGEEVAAVFKAADDARKMSANSNVQEWNQATNMVITGKAGGHIMGDWAQGEFQVAGQVAGEDYVCLPGLGVNNVISSGGDAFYFPKIDDPEISAAQEALASTLLAKETQVAFNLKKGSLPVRSDIDMEAANDCMRKGLDILANGTVIKDIPQMLSADSAGLTEDLFVEFFNNKDMSAEEAQEQFVEIIADAE